MSIFSNISTANTMAHADGGASAPPAGGSNAGTWLNGVTGILNGIGSVFTGWGSVRNPQNPNQPGAVVIPGAPQQGNNTALIVGIVVVVLVIGGVLLWVAKRKK